VFNYAIATARFDSNPTLALHGALQTRKASHYAAITKPDKIAILMRQIEGYPYKVIRCALKFSALVFCRPGEIRHAEWSEVDFQKAEWIIPAEKMKMRRLHRVPLARQTLDVLTEMKAVTGHQKWIFPSARNDGKCMSENAIRVALRSMGYGNEDMTAHGFRAMASTTFYENGFPRNHVEMQLAHAEKNAVIEAYNHAEYLPQRREMMQWWADWLDGVRNSVS
jgi:integrase